MMISLSLKTVALLLNVGEQVYQLSDELKKKYPEQPWNLVAGLR